MRSLKRFLSSATLLSFSAGLTLGTVVTTASAALRGSGVFPDVPQGSYYDDAIGIMYGEGIITGYSDGKFGPDDPVTRGQIAVIMQRLMLEIGAIDDTDSSSSRSTRSSSSSHSSEDDDEDEDDGEPNDNGALGFTVTQFDVSESSTKASVAVTRSEGDNGKVTVEYETVDDTAKAGEDYTANSGTLTFEDGETSKTISVTLKNDDSGEDLKAFKVQLKNPTGGAELGKNPTVTIRILDNDGGAGASGGGTSSTSSVSSVGTAGALSFGGSAYAVEEDAGNLTVYINRTGGTKGQVGVTYDTKSGSASDGTHFTRSTGTLSFSDGETQKSFTVPIIDDGETKGNKTFSMTLAAPTGSAVLGKNSNVSVSIVDNEAITTGTGTFRIGEDELDILEGETAYMPVLRMSGTTTELTVKYETVNGTAQAGADFIAASGTLTFKPGESSKYVEVKVIKDDKNDEVNERFTVRVFEPSNGGSLGSPTSGIVNISE
jgi:hypothetical protein